MGMSDIVVGDLRINLASAFVTLNIVCRYSRQSLLRLCTTLIAYKTWHERILRKPVSVIAHRATRNGANNLLILCFNP